MNANTIDNSDVMLRDLERVFTHFNEISGERDFKDFVMGLESLRGHAMDGIYFLYVALLMFVVGFVALMIRNAENVSAVDENYEFKNKRVLEESSTLSNREQRERIESVFSDNSAGRWCEMCGVHGSHHSDKHYEFLAAALTS